MSKYEELAPSAWEHSRSHNDEIDLRELIANLWDKKWLVLAAMMVFAVAGAMYAVLKPNVYQASTLLAPTNEDASLSGVSGQLGGLASLAGINVSNNGSSQTVLAKEVLQSRAFLADFIGRHNLEAPLLATVGWSDAKKSWIYNHEVYAPETGQWLTNDDGKSFTPTDWDLVKAFKNDHLTVSENKDNGMVTLKVKSLSPVASQRWAEWLVADINEHIRRKDVVESNARIAYLEDKLKDTSVTGMQQIFYQLIETETRTVMLANAQKEYVFETIDPAVVPQEKSDPGRVLIITLSTLLGFIVGVFLLCAKFAFSSVREGPLAKTQSTVEPT